MCHHGEVTRPVVLRPRFGIVLTVLVWLVCAVSVVSLGIEYGVSGALVFGPSFVLGGYLCWMLFWAPAVALDPSGVSLVNLVRTRRITWPAIASVDTRYTLTIQTVDGRRYGAWAAPAPSRYALMRASKAELTRLPETSYGPDGTIAFGDLPGSDSGLAALYVRRNWEALREAGHLDSGVVEGTGVVTTWHRGQLLVLAVLALAAVGAHLL